MAYSKTLIGGFLIAVSALAAIAVVGSGLPLAALLIIGVVLCCPLMMLGMHGGGRDRGGRSSRAAGGSEAKPPSGPGDGR